MKIDIDIGSTIIKIFERSPAGVASQKFIDRNYDVSISDQLVPLLKSYGEAEFRICSSANGGLRVGLIALSKRFSAQLAQGLLLKAGANVIYTQLMTASIPDQVCQKVDALVVVGGIDSENDRLGKFMDSLDLTKFPHDVLVYAGNRYCAPQFAKRFSSARCVENFLGDELQIGKTELLSKVRDLYLDDLVKKDGVSSLQKYSIVPIWPTPAIVGLAYEEMSRQRLSVSAPLPSLLLDIGGATTDLHFGSEILDAGATPRIESYQSVNRFVFSELGVFTSRESTIKRLSGSHHLYAFFKTLYGENTTQYYLDFREGRLEDRILFYACLFIALESVYEKRELDAPCIDLNKVASIVITGGASRVLEIEKVKKILQILIPANRWTVNIVLDSQYQIWTAGIEKLEGCAK